MIIRVNFGFHGISFGAARARMAMAMDGFGRSITQQSCQNKVRMGFASAASGAYLEAL
jgi:hypothetical protein